MCCQAIQKLFNRDVVGEVSLEVQELSLFLSIMYVVYDMLYFGQVENAEVRKPKYGSEKKSRLSVSNAILTHSKAL